MSLLQITKQERVMSKKSNSFVTDLEFCPTCGTILPLPGMDDYVTCKLCGYKIHVQGMYKCCKICLQVTQHNNICFYASFFQKEFDGVKITSSIVFNRPETLQTNAEEGETSTGPLVSPSGHDTLTYHQLLEIFIPILFSPLLFLL